MYFYSLEDGSKKIYKLKLEVTYYGIIWDI